MFPEYPIPLYLAEILTFEPALACFKSESASDDNMAPEPETDLGAPDTFTSHEATSNVAFKGISGGYLANNLFILPTADLLTVDPVARVPK